MSNKNIYNTKFTTEETLETVLEKLENPKGITISEKYLEAQAKRLGELSKKEAEEKIQYSKKKKSSGFGEFLKRNKKLKEAQKTRRRIYAVLYQRAILDTLLCKVETKLKEIEAELETIEVEKQIREKKTSALKNKLLLTGRKGNLERLHKNIEKKIKRIDKKLDSENVEEALQHIPEEGSEAAAVLEVVKKSCEKMKEDKASKKIKEKKNRKDTDSDSEYFDKKSDSNSSELCEEDFKTNWNELFDDETNSPKAHSENEENAPTIVVEKKKRKRKIRLRS